MDNISVPRGDQNAIGEAIRFAKSKYSESIRLLVPLNDYHIPDTLTDGTYHSPPGVYDLSENLLFILQLYNITSADDLLKDVCDVMQQYVSGLSDKKTLLRHWGMGAVCAALYQITAEVKYLDHALSVITLEESVKPGPGSTEQVIVDNLFILLRLFRVSGQERFLLKINLSILKLLKYARFARKSISWSFLDRLSPSARQHAGRTLKLIFYELYRFSGNDTFLHIADNLRKTGHKANSRQHVPPDQVTGGQRRRCEQISPAHIATGTLVCLSSLSSAGEPDLHDQIPQIIGKLTSRYPAKRNPSTHRPGFPKDFIAAVVHYYAYQFTSDERYLSLFYSKFHSEPSGPEYHDHFSELAAGMIVFNHTFFNLLLFRGTGLQSYSPWNKKSCKPDTISNYPGICLSKAELKQFILSNRFKRSIQLLNGTSPRKWQQYLNDPIFSGTGSVPGFLRFVQGLLKSNLPLKSYLGPILSLELKAHQLTERYRYGNHVLANDAGLKSRFLKLDVAAFSTAALSAGTDIEIVRVKWHPVLKIYTFTFAKQFIHQNEDFVAVRYNHSARRVEEFIVNEMTALTLRLFKKEPSVTKVAAEICALIGQDQSDEIRLLVIGKIKKLVELDWLTITQLHD